MKLSEAVAKRMKELLFQNKVSQYKLVQETGLNRTTIQSLIKGRTPDVKLSTVLLIANFFNMSLSEFLNDNIFEYQNIDV